MARHVNKFKFLKPVFLWGGLALAGAVIYALGTFWLQRGWDGKSRFTVVDLGSPVRVLSFDPATHQGLRLTLPTDLWVSTGSGRGRFPVSTLVVAGSSAWAARSITDELGIFSQGELTHLNWVDKWRWWWAARGVQWRAVDLAAAGLVNYHQTADGTSEGELAPNWEQTALGWFTSLTVAQEQLAVRVVNTTSVPGLAATAARQIETSGMKVVEVANSSDEVDKCHIVGSVQLQKSVGGRLMRQNYNCDWQIGEPLTLYLGR